MALAIHPGLAVAGYEMARGANHPMEAGPAPIRYRPRQEDKTIVGQQGPYKGPLTQTSLPLTPQATQRD